jgi:PAS domain S-box-containing protein
MPHSLTDLAGLKVSAEDFLVAVLETTAQPIWVVDPEGRIRFANAAAVDALGYDSADELLGRQSPVPATGRTVSRDLDGFERRDGSSLPVSYVSTPIEMAEGCGAVLAFTNAEDRVRDERLRHEHEATLAQLADEQAALRRVATLVARGGPRSELFRAVTEEVGRLFRADLAGMIRYESDATVCPVAVWAAAGEHPPVPDRWSTEAGDPTTLVAETRRTARVDDWSGVPGPISAFIRDVGIQSSVGSPILVEGGLWGALAIHSKQPHPLPADTESRLENFTELVATAIANVAARSELAASRARIVAATDEERRRVVRDLHDGAQQRLVQTVMTLKLAEGALQNGEQDAPALVSQALENAEQATTELRELAHGILPAVLTQGGLRAGVGALASRMSVPVDVDASEGRLPPAVEATAYFVVAEALTNVAKHSRAGRAAVAARVEDGVLAVRVRDDGVGGARADGSGLLGLADRVAVLDGQFRVESPAGGGTLVAADFPVPG